MVAYERVDYNASVILSILTYSQSFGLYSGKAKIMYRDVKLPDCETQNREHQKYEETAPKAWSWLATWHQQQQQQQQFIQLSNELSLCYPQLAELF